MPSLTGDRSEPEGWLQCNRDGGDDTALEHDIPPDTLGFSLRVTLDHRELTDPFRGTPVTFMRDVHPPTPVIRKVIDSMKKKFSKFSFYYRKLVKNEGLISDGGR